jgi:hypothetical protein
MSEHISVGSAIVRASWTAFAAAVVVLTLVFGFPALVFGVAIGAVVAWRSGQRPSPGAIPAGIGLVFLYVAWHERRGPGLVCVGGGGAQQCTQYLSPIPWLAAGVLLLAAGLLTRLTRHGSMSAR